MSTETEKSQPKRPVILTGYAGPPWWELGEIDAQLRPFFLARPTKSVGNNWNAKVAPNKSLRLIDLEMAVALYEHAAIIWLTEHGMGLRYSVGRWAVVRHNELLVWEWETDRSWAVFRACKVLQAEKAKKAKQTSEASDA